jgi:hypothetical protein
MKDTAEDELGSLENQIMMDDENHTKKEVQRSLTLNTRIEENKQAIDINFILREPEQEDQ